jgi:hypothetical protein
MDSEPFDLVSSVIDGVVKVRCKNNEWFAIEFATPPEIGNSRAIHTIKGRGATTESASRQSGSLHADQCVYVVYSADMNTARLDSHAYPMFWCSVRFV